MLSAPIATPAAHVPAQLPSTGTGMPPRVIVTPPAQPGELARAYGDGTDGAGRDSGYPFTATKVLRDVSGSFDDAVTAARDIAQQAHLDTRVHRRLFGWHDLPVPSVAVSQVGHGWRLTQVNNAIDPAQEIGYAWSHKMWMDVGAPPAVQRSTDDVAALVGWSRWFDLRGPAEPIAPTKF